MARGRLILKSLSTSKKWNEYLDRKDYFTKYLYLMSYLHADDWGMTEGDPQTIRRQILPEEPAKKPTFVKIETSLKKLHNAELITWYESDGQKVVHFTGFDKTQSGALTRRTKKSCKWLLPKEIPNSSLKFTEIQRNSPLSKEKLKELNLREVNILIGVYPEYNNIHLSQEQYDRLKKKWGEKGALQAIKTVSDYCGSTGKTYSDYLRTIWNWENRDGQFTDWIKLQINDRKDDIKSWIKDGNTEMLQSAIDAYGEVAVEYLKEMGYRLEAQMEEEK